MSLLSKLRIRIILDPDPVSAHFFQIILQLSLESCMKVRRLRSGSSAGTICPVSSDPFYIVTYHIKWVTTFLTNSTKSGFEHTDLSLMQN